MSCRQEIEAMVPAEKAEPASVTVQTVGLSQLDEWDRYVTKNPDATFFHRAGWYRVISQAFGHKPHYLRALDCQSKTVGVLPLFEVRSWLFGHYLVSTPCAVYGGAIAESAPVRGCLEDEAVKLASELGVDYMELRTVSATRGDWPVKTSSAGFVRELEVDPDKILQSIPKKQRAVVRKSLKFGFDEVIQNHIDDFYLAYSTSVRNLGTPVFSREYFQLLKDEFGEECEIVAVSHQGSLHCALMTFYFRDQVLPYYGGGLPASRKSKAMDYMYYELMCRAARTDRRIFDFGRSKIDSGPYHYKRHWGFSPQPLEYQFQLVRASELPRLDTTNPKYSLAIAAWRRLPLWLSQRMGPYLSRYLA